MTILLCGTSGCGKSTLSALLVSTENLLVNNFHISSISFFFTFVMLKLQLLGFNAQSMLISYFFNREADWA